MGPGSKRALRPVGPGPDGPWAQRALGPMGSGPNGSWAQWALGSMGPGPNGPWAQWAQCAHMGRAKWAELARDFIAKGGLLPKSVVK